LDAGASDGKFEGKLRAVSGEAGLNSVRSAEAVKLLEDTGRIEVVQRGRRGRDTIVNILSTQSVAIEDAEAMLPSRGARRSPRLSYDEIGRAVVDRLLELSRHDSLRAAQVEAFAADSRQQGERVEELEVSLESAANRETELRISLKAAEEALARAEENLRAAIGPAHAGAPPRPVEDEDARAVLEILRSGRV
jgi:hypothetical protein